MPDKPCLLVVGGDTLVVDLLGELLQKDGYEVRTAGSAREGLRLARRKHPDAIILDMSTPGMDNSETCHRLCDTTDSVVVLVTAKGHSAEALRCSQVTVDECITRPFKYSQLTSRLAGCLRRRATGMSPRVLKAPTDLVLLMDPERHLVTLNGREVQLTPKEYEVLKYLMRFPGKVLPPDAILADAWGPDYLDEHYLVKQVIYRLRRKLEPDPAEPRFILTVWGSGYVFETGAST